MGFLDRFVMSSNIHGSAKFMGFWEKLGFLNPFNKGVVIDGKNRITQRQSFAHIKIEAPTRAGKSTTYVAPNILQIKGVNLVVFDPSQELYQLSHKYLERKGYEIKKLNPTNLPDSARYNPLKRLETFTDIRKLCDILISAAFPKASGADSFWNDSAKGIIELIIRAVKKLPEAKQNLKEVYRILNRIETDVDEINLLMAENLDSDGFDQYKAFVVSEQKIKNSILVTARTALGKLSDPDIAELTSSEDLYFETLRTKKTVLFIMIEEAETDYYAFLLTILYSQLFQFCMKMPEKGKKYVPIFFLMDEFANSGQIPGFPSLITVLGKRKVSLSIIIQDFRQLEDLYGLAGAETISNNCASKLFFPGLSLATCEKLERILGKTTLQHEEGKSKSWTGKGGTTRELGRSLMTAQEIRTMKDEAIFIYGNRLPIKIRLRPWFKSFKLRSRTR